MYSIQKADLAAHKNLLQALWKRNFDNVIANRYDWIYKKNPGGDPIIFLLKHEESGLYVGAISMFPRNIFVNGKKIMAFICGDMVVDSSHRSLGPAISMLKAAVLHCRKCSPCLLLSFPNKKSELVALRAGFKIIGQFCEMTKVIKTTTYLLRYINSPLVARILSFSLDCFFWIRYELPRRKMTRRYNFQILDKFDERFDIFWQKIFKKFVVIGERTSSYLNWRLKETPYTRNRIFTLLSDTNIDGYIAFFIRENRCHIVDMAYDGKEKHLHALLRLFSVYQRSLGSNSISISLTGHATLVKQLKKEGFHIRATNNKVIYCASHNELELINHIEKGLWYLTSTDNDI